MGWTPDTQTASVIATISLNTSIGAAVLLLFELLRSQSEIYAPRLRCCKHHTNVGPDPRLLRWIPQTWSIPDDSLLAASGMDGYVFLRFLRMCFSFGLVASVLGLVVLIPVYITSPPTPDVFGISLYSMGNINSGSRRLWTCLVFTYVFTASFLYIIHKEYEHFAKRRKEFFKQGDPNLPQQMNFCAQIENIPRLYRTSERFKNFIEKIFPDEVLHSHVLVAVDPLDEAVKNRNLAQNYLELAIAEFEAGGRKDRPQLSLAGGKPVMCYGADETVDSIDHWTRVLEGLCEKVSILQAEAVAVANGSGVSAGDDGVLSKMRSVLTVSGKASSITADMVTGTGFVTFKSKRAQAVACQVPILSEQYPEVSVLPAPAPTDIIWANMLTKPAYTEHASNITASLFSLGLVFWGVILAFIAAVSSLSNLENYLPFIQDLDPVIYALLSGQLPVVILIVFVSLLPVIMAAVAQYVEKRKTISAVQQEVFRWFFKYQIANVLVIVLAGSIFNSLYQAIDNPASIISLLGAALPTVSVFFINFILTQLLSGVPLVLLRIAPYIMYKLHRLLMDPAKMTRRGLVEGPLVETPVDYGVTLPPVLYILFIMLIYWVIAPIVVFVSTLYFGAAYLAWKYQFAFVIVPQFESGGQFWYGLYDNSMLGLMVSALTMIGYMSIKEGIAQAPLLIPLPIFIIAAWRYTEGSFKSMSQNLPYSAAVDVDVANGDPSESVVLNSFSPDYCKQPALVSAAVVKPLPYRIGGIPLLDSKGCMNEVYHTVGLESAGTDVESAGTATATATATTAAPTRYATSSSSSHKSVKSDINTPLLS